METPQGRPQTIEKHRKDRDNCDRLDRKFSIRKTETIARDRKYFNGNHFRATGTTQKTETTQKYPMMHRTLPTVFQNGCVNKVEHNAFYRGSAEIRQPLLMITNLVMSTKTSSFG